MTISVNTVGMSHARSLIAAGHVDMSSDWSFSADDGNAMLGSSNDWGMFSKFHLAVDSEADKETKEHYKYPFGKSGKVYRSGVIAIRQRAGQQGQTNVFDAAGTLLELIDKDEKSMKKKSFDCKFEIKAVADDGTFDGYGSVFGVKDSYNDIVVKGAFAESLKTRPMPALLWQHDSDEPIGVYTEMREDDTGLYVKGRLALKTQRGAEAYELLKMGAISGMSIGYVTRDDSYDKVTGVSMLKQVDLWEVSLVTFPANDSARVSGVKSVEDMKSAETFLRDLGLSRKDAQTFLSRVKGLTLSDSEAGDEAKELIAVLTQRSKHVPNSN